jgi:primosomal protein N' (replication factor Y)
VAYVRPTGSFLAGPTPAQAALLAALGPGAARVADLLRATGVSPSVLRGLVRSGVLERFTHRESPFDPMSAAGTAPPAAEDDFALTPGQHEAVDAITAAQASDAFRVFLLFGVPGSGKTEVYVRSMRAALARGRQAILLIPEIALATQVVDRLARRFARVAVLHSRLPAARRRDTLAAIAAGAVDVVIGTRTAVFAPCPRLGLLVVDEEQESSFKSLATPLFHARDVAIKRGQLEQVPVVLGSATPSLETWHNAATRAHFSVLRLPERVPGARLPEVRSAPVADDERALLGTRLRSELHATLEARQQAILLHNRRGYAVFLRCPRCGLTVSCERCGSHLVFHAPQDELRCHHCGARRPVPLHCLDDTCGGPLVRAGAAIQRLEEELARQFPAARVLRLDSDTMRKRSDYRDALERFEGGAADVLIGTQMVAKGLDFPGVRLVGVIAADAALRLPDFRAAERVLQLIVQVVGRAGRRAGASLAVVQTAERPAAVVRHALQLDYERFAVEELAQRTRLEYPPTTRMVRIVLADARPHRARDEATRLVPLLRERGGRVHAALRVDDAEPCIVRQLRELLRWQVLVRAPREARLQDLLREIWREPGGAPRVQRSTIDVDPVDLL